MKFLQMACFYIPTINDSQIMVFHIKFDAINYVKTLEINNFYKKLTP
ncbi:hypothetical protein EDB96_0403 [Flavobacterium sp. S87F.05.LMB.W.Kidney.N]|jgi:hypothetical protein|nr:hypothetical protein [Flavobacterium sp. SORGH_AS_0622]TDX13699.1 hypothetical protein EDB96_0403 [Flavobacterium sp. S87F.05.LMB.W.Kidney.N]